MEISDFMAKGEKSAEYFKGFFMFLGFLSGYFFGCG
jgi:hypothetical protein